MSHLIPRSLQHRYLIRFGGPQRWELLADDKHRSWHPTSSEAQVTALRVDRTLRFRAAAIRSLVVVAACVVGLVVVTLNRMAPNPAYQPARAAAAEIEAAFDLVVSGDASLGVVPSDVAGFSGALVTVSFDITIGSAIAPRTFAALAGSRGGTCFVIKWTAPDRPIGGILRPSVPCEPGPALADGNNSFESLSFPGSPIDWERVLPPPTKQRVWFIAAVIALGLVMLSSLISLSLARRRPVRPIRLAIEGPEHAGRPTAVGPEARITP